MHLKGSNGAHFSRRNVIIAGAGVLAAPYVIGRARAAETVKIGFVDPFTGPYASFAHNEQIGAQMAVDALNAKNGILGRKIELISEDTQSNVGVGVQKANKLLDRDNCDFLAGTVASNVSQAIAQVCSQKKKLFMVTGGHVDDLTGKACTWNVYRVCNTTYTVALATASAMVKKFGKRWYFMVPDYSFGHALHENMLAAVKSLGGEEVGFSLKPLGSTDFSAELIKCKAANPQVVGVIQGGDDQLNLLKQANQFGISKSIPFVVPLSELEVIAALPPSAQTGYWNLEWYWDQPNTPHVKEFIDAYQKHESGKVPTARTYFGYVAIHALALAAEKAKTLDNERVGEALSGLEMPPEVALEPERHYFDPKTHQYVGGDFPGNIKEGATYPKLFTDISFEYATALQAPGVECHLTQT
ncbi:MAG: ABC transporter substrate-binding protein [Acetobacteraceae bacterium]|nr:ABC transporter substrate-binding protein [Acetobacteraceae bacterium]